MSCLSVDVLKIFLDKSLKAPAQTSIHLCIGPGWFIVVSAFGFTIYSIDLHLNKLGSGMSHTQCLSSLTNVCA